MEAAAYLHLNPIRISEMGLGKSDNRVESAGWKPLYAEMIEKRIRHLREYAWSSYPYYAGYRIFPKWLHGRVLLGRSGGKGAYAAYVESFVKRGMRIDIQKSLKEQIWAGTTKFKEKMKKKIGPVSREQPERKALRRLVTFDKVVTVVEEERGESWESFKDRWGDPGRDLVLYLARKRTGLTLRELGEAVGGMDYKVVGKAVQRFKKRLREEKVLRDLAGKCLVKMTNDET